MRYTKYRDNLITNLLYLVVLLLIATAPYNLWRSSPLILHQTMQIFSNSASRNLSVLIFVSLKPLMFFCKYTVFSVAGHNFTDWIG